MRTIKFRGYSAQQKEWVYGSLHVFEAVRQPSSPKTYIRSGQQNKDWVKVEPTSVGQFTGLSDRNREDIYEGDIIVCDMIPPEVVIFKDGRFATVPKDKPYRDTALIVSTIGEGCIVIGNIHDNPELLN